jgi:hypothetical protein
MAGFHQLTPRLRKNRQNGFSSGCRMFARSLAFGNHFASLALKRYAKTRDVETMEGYFKDYDALVHGFDVPEKVEVKTDTYAHKYNSFFIEWTYKNEPSGIQTTKADTWLHVVWKPNGSFDCYAIPIQRLKDGLLNERVYEKCGGDYGHVVGKIVPRDLFADCLV